MLTHRSTQMSATVALALLLGAGCGGEVEEGDKDPETPSDDSGSVMPDTGDTAGDIAGDIAGDTAGDTSAPTETETTPVRLNQLVTRLLLAQAPAADTSWTVTREREGWLFLTMTGALAEGQTARVGVDVDDPAHAQLTLNASAGTAEAMLKVEAGEHQVHLWLEGGAAPDRVEVRAIPALRYDRLFPEDGMDEDLGDDDWEFLETYALDQLTTMVADWHWNGEAWMTPWRALHRDWYTNSGNGYGAEAEMISFYDTIVGTAASAGIGLDLDEFGGTDVAQWAAWTAGLQWATSAYPDTPLALYIGSQADLDTDGPREFVRAMLDLDHELLIEWYIGEQPSEADLAIELEAMAAAIAADRALFPGFEDQAVLVLGGSSHSYVNYDFYPDINFKVHLDRQLERVATDERFQDLHGLGFWTSSYMDEETIWWMMALYRHYGIEGATTPLSEDPYRLPHVQNPDFEAEDGWTLASSGLIGLSEYEWISEYEARWGSPEGVGDSFLYMTRGSGDPSTATQEITGLEAGRTYSLRFFTIWYEDLYNLRGDAYDYQRDHSVHAELDGAELVEGSDIVVSCDSTWPAAGVWVNQHRLRFVADSENATVTLTDQATAADGAVEVWETFLFNFVQVQPYFDE